MLKNTLILSLFFFASCSCLIAQTKVLKSPIKVIKKNPTSSLKTESIQPIFSFGNFKSDNVSVEEFKKELVFFPAEGYVINNISIYFAGAGFTNTILVGVGAKEGVSVTPINPVAVLKSQMDKLTKGSIVAFDNIKLRGNDGIKNFPGRKFTLY